MYFLDRMRFHGAADYEIVYERDSIIAARYEFLEAVQRVAPEAFIELGEIAKDQSLESQEPHRAE